MTPRQQEIMTTIQSLYPDLPPEEHQAKFEAIRSGTNPILAREVAMEQFTQRQAAAQAAAKETTTGIGGALSDFIGATGAGFAGGSSTEAGSKLRALREARAQAGLSALDAQQKGELDFIGQQFGDVGVLQKRQQETAQEGRAAETHTLAQKQGAIGLEQGALTTQKMKGELSDTEQKRQDELQSRDPQSPRSEFTRQALIRLGVDAKLIAGKSDADLKALLPIYQKALDQAWEKTKFTEGVRQFGVQQQTNLEAARIAAGEKQEAKAEAKSEKQRVEARPDPRVTNVMDKYEQSLLRAKSALAAVKNISPAEWMGKMAIGFTDLSGEFDSAADAIEGVNKLLSEMNFGHAVNMRARQSVVIKDLEEAIKNLSAAKGKTIESHEKRGKDMSEWKDDPTTLPETPKKPVTKPAWAR